jgi:transcriptional regulator with XRE-family HTH domain
MRRTVLARNIAALRGHLGLKQAPFADALGVNQSYISKWETKNIEPSTRSLAQMAELAEVPINDFINKPWTPLADRSPMVNVSPDQPPIRNASIDDGTVEITALDLTLSMGPGTHIDDWVESEPVKFDIGFLRAITRSPFNRLRLVRGIGDSMYPTLNGGDAIMIDTTQNSLSRQDGIYWISLHGAAGIKRLRAIARDRVLVMSDNPGVDNQEVAAEDLRIEGRAIWFARDL